MFPPMNQMAPLSSAPLATNASIMGLMNRQTLPTSGEYRKVFVGKIPTGLSDAFVMKLLEVFIKLYFLFLIKYIYSLII